MNAQQFVIFMSCAYNKVQTLNTWNSVQSIPKGYMFYLKKSLVADKEFIAECSSRVEESNMKRKLMFIEKYLPGMKQRSQNQTEQ